MENGDPNHGCFAFCSLWIKNCCGFRILKLGFIAAMVCNFMTCKFFRPKEHHISIKEVIPEAKVISEADGVIEYKGVKFYLGTNRLLQKKALIESLNLCDRENLLEVDMRFSQQIIIRERQ